MNTPTLYILGAGSIGLLWACRLAEKGHAPVLITREPSPLFSVTRHSSNQQHAFNFQTCCPPLSQPIHFLLITTKAHQTQQAVNAIRHVIMEDAVIVLLQNGMGNGEWLAAEFPQAKIYLGTTTDGVFRNTKTEFSVAGTGETYFGPLQPGLEKSAIASLLNAAPNTAWDDNILTRLWQKLAVNCVINPLAALYECRNGELITNQKYFQHFSRVATETQEAIRSLGISLPQTSLLDFAKMVAEKTAQNINSMLADKRTGCGTEIDFILGYLLSKVHPAHYPELESLYQAVKHFPRPTL
ncbi:MAG TPA: 2-dehydropantoate 2-reductase [Pseudomonadales bacterium]|nr:2-dehydropantoate 2-reductase [Pseudomonadales bacterium]